MQVHRDAFAKQSASQRRPRSGRVETVVVRRDVWKEAMRLARGDPRKIRIISERKVEIIE